MRERQAIQVPREVYEGLERVRAEGRTNMLDRDMAARLAYEAGDYAAALWVEENREAYAKGIFAGFAPADEEAR